MVINLDQYNIIRQIEVEKIIKPIYNFKAGE